MQRVFLAIVLSLALLAPGLHGGYVRPALACSAPDYNPVAESDLIVGGWVTNWSERPDIETVGHYMSIEFTSDVDHVYRGRHVSKVEAIDRTSYMPAFGHWVGSSGTCGAFDEDPLGMYVILGLKWSEGSFYASHLMRTFYIGDAPSGSWYDEAVSRLESRIAITPPITGSAGLAP